MFTPMQHKITDANFSFREYQPIRFIEWQRSGASSPMRAECLDQSGERVECVIKLKGNSALPTYAPLFETVGAWLACQLEIAVAEPVMINITERFAKGFQEKPEYEWIRKSIGLNFGTRHLGNGLILPPQDMLYASPLQEQAMQIFIFDLFIQNVDRNHRKPNMLTDRKQFFVFDHEKAFAFVLALLRPPEPWKLTELDLSSWVGSHFFHKALQDGYNKWGGDVFMQTLKAIDSTFWDNLEQHLPGDWHSSKLADIKAVLSGTVNQLGSFETAVQRMLDSTPTQTV